MQAGGREGWRHKPVQLTKSFVPHRGWEWGTPVFYGGGVLSFYSQSFRSVSETEGKKKTKTKTPKTYKTTNKHATYENLAREPQHSPGMVCQCLALDFSLFSPLLRLPCSQQPPQPSPTTEPSAWHRAGVALPHPTGMGGFSQQQEVEVPMPHRTRGIKVAAKALS